MKMKSENRHETPAETMKRISIQVNDDILREEAAAILKKHPDFGRLHEKVRAWETRKAEIETEKTEVE